MCVWTMHSSTLVYHAIPHNLNDVFFLFFFLTGRGDGGGYRETKSEVKHAKDDIQQKYGLTGQIIHRMPQKAFIFDAQDFYTWEISNSILFQMYIVCCPIRF